jgi:hypothetical protein
VIRVFGVLHPTITWLPMTAAFFALGAGVWLLVEMRRTTRPRGVVPIEAIFIDDDDGDVEDCREHDADPTPAPVEAVETNSPPMAHALVPLYVFASTLPDRSVPVPTPAELAPPPREREPDVRLPAPEPTLDLVELSSQLVALTEAVARLTDRFDGVGSSKLRGEGAQPEPVPIRTDVESVPPAGEDDLLAWPSDGEINRFYGYERGSW